MNGCFLFVLATDQSKKVLLYLLRAIGLLPRYDVIDVKNKQALEVLNAANTLFLVVGHKADFSLIQAPNNFDCFAGK